MSGLRAYADATAGDAREIAERVRSHTPLVRKAAWQIHGRVRDLFEVEDLIQIGAYEAKSSPELDEAIRLQPLLSVFLRQNEDERFGYEDAWGLLRGMLR
jgi:flagellum-specific ATP synthase